MGLKFLDEGYPAGGLYVHIPFCRRKCFYCDFYSVGSSKADFSLFTRSLLSELAMRSRELPHPVNSIYFGGGTPSLLPSGSFLHVVSAIREYFPDQWETNRNEWHFNGEFTIEVNPEDVSEEKCRAWKSAGVNRVSMGVQSFNDQELKRIGRRHTAAEALSAISVLRKYFDNVSIDLIFGLPGQKIRDWEYSLQKSVQTDVQHISLYSLMFEDGTPLTIMRDQGRIEELPDEFGVEMFRRALPVLVRSGFERYEISNYALPGYESRHNSSYWSGAPYLGLGPGAHSYDGRNVRRMNPQDVVGYIRHFTDNTTGLFYEEEKLSEVEMQEEYLLTRIRRKEGISVRDYTSRFGNDAGAVLMRRAETLSDLVEIVSGHIRLTQKGVMVSDRVILELSEF